MIMVDNDIDEKKMIVNKMVVIKERQWYMMMVMILGGLSNA